MIDRVKDRHDKRKKEKYEREDREEEQRETEPECREAQVQGTLIMMSQS